MGKNNKIIEAPVISIDNYNQDKVFILHNYINTKGKLVIDKEEASLLILELYKFINLK